MVSFYGDYDLTETVNIPFNTFSSDDPSASVTVTNLANGDVYVHQDGVEGTPTGITVSLNVGSVNGNHLAILDLSDTHDVGFYAVGSRYQVRIEGVTVDGGTLNVWIGAFSIGCTLRPTTAGRKLTVESDGVGHADLKEWLGVAPLALSSQQVQTDMTAIHGTALTETATQLAGAFVKFFNVSSPTGTVNSLADAVPGAAGGGFIAGTNAETTVTTAINANLIGNITGDITGTLATVTAVSNRVTADMTYIHGTALTETSGQLAGRFTDFFDQASTAFSVVTALSSFKATGFSTHNAAAVKTALEADSSKLDHLWEMTEDDSGTRRLTTNALEQGPDSDTTTNLTLHSDYDAAKTAAPTAPEIVTALSPAIYPSIGAVYYVANDGNDSNSGLTPGLAKLTPKTVIEAASAGDVVVLLPGTFALGDNIIDVPNGVSLRGAGMDVTTLTSTATLSGGSPKGVIIRPGSNSVIEDLTVRGIAGGGSLYQACFGVHSTYQDDFQNVLIRRCRGFATNDCVYIKDVTACDWILEDCVFESEYDTYAHITSVAGSSAILRRCHLIASATAAANAVVTVGGTIRLEDCTLEATTASTTARAVSVQSSNATLYAFNTRLRTSGGTPLDVFQASSGTVVLIGCDYDYTKTSGTITNVSGLDAIITALDDGTITLHSNYDAAKTAAQAGDKMDLLDTIMEDT